MIKKYCEAIIHQWNEFILKNDFKKSIVKQLSSNEINLFLKMIKTYCEAIIHQWNEFIFKKWF